MKSYIYDHFYIYINKKRFKIINNNSQDKHILITSIKNLFDRYPTIDNNLNQRKAPKLVHRFH